jgi:thioredoxin 1
MAMTNTFADVEPTRADVDALRGPTVVEFGTSWCGVSRAAQPLIAAAMARHACVRHLKIEDGPGRPLGRSFRVKLWPTLVFLRDGKEVAKLVRPRDAHAIDEALAQIDVP